MQDYFLLRRRNLFPLFFVSLLLFVCFCLSPKKVMHRCDRGERGAERQAKLFYHSDTNFQRCLFIIMRLLASFIIRNSEANTDFVPGSTFERHSHPSCPPLPTHLFSIDGVNFSPLCWHFNQFSYGP